MVSVWERCGSFLADGRVRRQGEDVLWVGDGPSACLGGHGRAVLVHRSAPGVDGRGGPRGGRDRAVRRRALVPGAGLRAAAGAVGVGAGAWGARRRSVDAAAGEVHWLRTHPCAVTGECAAASGGRGHGDRGGVAGQGLGGRASPGRGAGRAGGVDGSGVVAPARAGRGPGTRGARRGRRGVGHRVRGAGTGHRSGRGGGGAGRGAGPGGGSAVGRFV